MKFPDPAARLTLEQLAAAAGLPTRTVRYYIQLGLVNRPVGAKRAALARAGAAAVRGDARAA